MKEYGRLLFLKNNQILEKKVTRILSDHRTMDTITSIILSLQKSLNENRNRAKDPPIGKEFHHKSIKKTTCNPERVSHNPKNHLQS